jgi:glycosyltransferase involved in cell wall biosynthesis
LLFEKETVPEPSDTLVSVGLPVRNGGQQLELAIQSVLAQDYPNIELVISDNASSDETEAVCRRFAKSDCRIVYNRNAENVGLLGNFVKTIQRSKGEYFRWMSHDDILQPQGISRCMELFARDPRLVLVTSGFSYTGDDGVTRISVYGSERLGSDDPADRFGEMLRLLVNPDGVIDPLYGVVRRAVAAPIPRRKMLREDEVFAAKLALAGPWGHVAEVLAHRRWKSDNLRGTARLLGVPQWQTHFASVLQYRELLGWLSQVNLTADQMRRARRAVYRLGVRRQLARVQRAARKLDASRSAPGRA